MTGCRHPIAWVTARRWPCADPCHSSPAVRPTASSLPIVLGAGEAKVGLRLPAPGAHEQSPPLQGTGTVPRAESGGRGRGERQQLLQTLSRKPSEHSWKHQMTDLGFRGLQLALMARTCCGRRAGWRAPVFLSLTRLARPVWQHCFLGAGHWWPTVALGGRSLLGLAQQPNSREAPLKKISALKGSSREGPGAQPGGLSARRGPPWPLCPGVRRLLSPGVVGAG